MGKTKKLRPSLEAAAEKLAPRAVVDPQHFKKKKGAKADGAAPAGALSPAMRSGGLLSSVLDLSFGVSPGTPAGISAPGKSPTSAPSLAVGAGAQEASERKKKKKRKSSVGGNCDRFANEPIMKLVGASPASTSTGNAVSATPISSAALASAEGPPARELAPLYDTPRTSELPCRTAQTPASERNPGSGQRPTSSPQAITAATTRSSSISKALTSKSMVKYASTSGASNLDQSNAQAALKASDTEFNAVWPCLSKTDRREAVLRLSQVLEPLRLSNVERRRSARMHRLNARKSKREEKGPRQDCDDSDEEALSSKPARIEEAGARSDEAKMLLSVVRVGLNEVSRALEAGRVRLVLVCRDARPAILLQHLLAASYVHGARACAIGETSAALGALLGVQSAMALAFLHPPASWPSDGPSPDATVISLVQFISSRSQPLSMPWLPTRELAGPTTSGDRHRDTHTRVSEES